MELRHLIAVARQAAGYSQGRLAQRIGCSQSLIARIETGERNASPEVAARIARATRSPQVAAAICAACPVGRSVAVAGRRAA